MKAERINVLEDNEKHLAKGIDGNYDSASDDEEAMGDDDKDSSEEEAEYQKTLKKLQQAKKGDDKAEEKDEEIEDDSDSDSDYEYAGGDLALYDSFLDDTDELVFLKEAMTQISAFDSNYYLNLIAQLSQEELIQFNETMNGAEALKEREENVRKQCEEMENKK